MCGTCNKEIEVRWGFFAHQTLYRHLREHNDGKKPTKKAAQ
jgi:hypothetical protein